MKLRAPRSFVAAVFGLCLTASFVVAQQATPKPAATQAKGKKPKPPADTGDSTLPPKSHRAKEAKQIPFPVPVGEGATKVKIPSYDQLGNLLSVLEAAQADHIDADHVRLKTMTFDLNGTDGKEAYNVVMPTSILDLRTNVITSEEAVTIRTKDFELTGEKVEFNTVERSGELRGSVHMVIHNLKQVAAPGQPAADLQ